MVEIVKNELLKPESGEVEGKDQINPIHLYGKTHRWRNTTQIKETNLDSLQETGWHED